MTATRRLAAILAADVAGYSRLMGADEEGRLDTKQVGRELGVRYVLEGSVRRSGNQVRVNAQLIDAATDAHLWAERIDRDMSDLFWRTSTCAGSCWGGRSSALRRVLALALSPMPMTS